jgi:DnaK suppressor protein
VANDSEVVAQIEERLRSVEHALERLRQGAYRSCEVCGAPIGDAALEADPVRAHCEAHPPLA